MAGYKYLMTLNKEQQEEIISFYLAPNTITDTCKKFGISDRKYIKKFLVEHNVPIHTKEIICKLSQPKIEQTTFSHFGVNYPTKNKDIREKQVKTNLEKYGVPYFVQTKEFKDKAEKTCLKNYGVNCSLQSPKIRQKSCQSKLEKYGDENYNNREKAEQTCLDKYGIKNPMSSKDGIESKFRIKSYETKQKNHSFLISKQEEIFYKALLEKINSQDIIRQYRDYRYPFNCDFYIKSKDLFIELNLYWMHGRHKFNEEFDKNKLIEWQQKAIEHKAYNKAIETWTKRDIQKYSFAERNKLNYKTFYTLTEALDWIKEIKN